MTKLAIMKQLQQAVASLNRATALLEAKDAKIKQLEERIAMLEFACSARAKLERVKPITERIQ